MSTSALVIDRLYLYFIVIVLFVGFIRSSSVVHLLQMFSWYVSNVLDIKTLRYSRECAGMD